MTISYVEPTTFAFSGLANSAKASSFTIDEENKTIQIGASIIRASGTITMTDAPEGYKLVRTGNSAVDPEYATKATYENGVYTPKGGVSVGGYTLSDDGMTISYVEPTTFAFSGVADGAKASNFTIDEENKTMQIGSRRLQTRSHRQLCC